MTHKKESVVLLINCKDRSGIVARVAGFIHDFGGNILDSDHHTDEETNNFLMRMEFAQEDFQIPVGDIASAFDPIAKVLGCDTKFTSRATEPASVFSSQSRTIV